MTWLLVLILSLASPTSKTLAPTATAEICGTDVYGTPIACQPGETPPTTVVVHWTPPTDPTPYVPPPVEGHPYVAPKPVTPATATIGATRG